MTKLLLAKKWIYTTNDDFLQIIPNLYNSTLIHMNISSN